MSSDYDDLFRRASHSSLSRKEIDAVAEELAGLRRQPAAYDALAILGKGRAVWHRDIVESFLEPGNNSWVARKALQILCEDWRGRERYLEEIVRFVTGVPWDEDDWVRSLAMSEAGEYLRGHREPRLLRELLRIFHEQGNDESLQRTAYDALARAIGRDWSATSRHAAVDPAVIEEAKSRLVERGG